MHQTFVYYIYMFYSVEFFFLAFKAFFFKVVVDVQYYISYKCTA